MSREMVRGEIISVPPASPEDFDGEIAHLVHRLAETQRRLEELAGGQVDAVLLPDGQSYFLREAQKKLRQSEADLRDSAAIQTAILDALPAQIALLDPNGVIVAVNKAWRNFAGTEGSRASECAEGADYLRACYRASEAGEDSAVETAARIRAVLDGAADALSLDYPCSTPAGDLWFRMRVSPVRKDGSYGAVVLHTDITDSKLAERALREREAESSALAEALRVALGETERQVAIRTAELATANASLTAAVEHANAANLAKSQFLSRMSHELRTPMNAVLGYAQLLDRKYDEPEIKEFSGAILRGGRHLLQLIDEVLDIGRVESGELSISMESVALDEVINQAIAMVRPSADSAGIDITIHSETFRGIRVEADRRRLGQVFINLLGNAVKYNRKPGQVWVVCKSAADGMTRVEVSDTGFGIGAHDQAQLFQPFQRFGDLGIEGTGLGLALSYRFAALMGGRLGLAESSGAGSTFYVELKTAPPSAPRAAGSTEPHPAPGLNRGLRGTILCVEDNPANMRLIEVIVMSWKDVSLTGAANGVVALQLAGALVPDLILLDLHLPDMNGETVMHHLRQDPKTAAIPVVVLSADATPQQIQMLLSQGAAAYLTKPIDISNFTQVVEQFLTAN